jgi:hypothetical protein
MKSIKKMTVKELEAALVNAEKREDGDRSLRKFKCSCGKMHTINKCVVVQTHWYTPPRGCCEGDHWNEGELQIVCPTTDVRNRVMFETDDEVDWKLRGDYDYSPELQFSRNYKDLFKEVVEEYDRESCGSSYQSYNNEYFDKNRKKFGIYIGKKK